MATAVQITITLDSQQAQQAATQLNQSLAQVGVTGQASFAKAGQGAQQMTGHMATGLDAVRLLSQEFGLRLPRAIEAMISRSQGLSTAIQGIVGGLAAVAGIEVFAHLAKGAYDLYENYISLNAAADKYYETLQKTREADFGNARTIETQRQRFDQATQVAAKARSDAENLHNRGVAELTNPYSGIDPVAGVADLMKARDLMNDALKAQEALNASYRNGLGLIHDQYLQEIELKHAGDARLVGEAKINADAAKKIAVDKENRRYAVAEEKAAGNVSAVNAGVGQQSISDKIVQQEADAQRVLLNRAANLAIMKADDEVAQSKLQKYDLYVRKSEDMEREMTLAMWNEGKLQVEIDAATRAAQAKLDKDYFDSWLADQKDAANKRIAGLTGVPRILAEGQNAQMAINLNHPAMNPNADAERVAAASETNQKLKELEDNFTQSTQISVNEWTEAHLGAYEKIDAEGQKALADLQRAYDKAFKDKDGKDIGSDADHALLAQARSAITQRTQDEKNRLTEQNNATDLEYAQQAARAEARVREDGLMGWVAAYKNSIQEIEDAEAEHLAKMQEQAQKDGASQPEIEARKQAIVRESNAQIEQQNQQMQHQIAGTLQEAFTHPVDFIKSAMEKMFFEIVAAWVMRMKAFQSIFGSTMGALQPGGSAGGAGGVMASVLRGGGGITGGQTVAGGVTTSSSSGAQTVASGGSGTASIARAAGIGGGGASSTVSPGAAISSGIGSTAQLAQQLGLTSSGSATDAAVQQLNTPTDSGSMNPEFDASQGAGIIQSPSWLAQNGTAALGAAAGGYAAYSGTVNAFKSGNPLTGAAADAGEGALIGSIVPGVGTAVGAAVGAAIGAGAGIAGLVTGMGGKLSARDYYNKQVFPALNDMMAHPNGNFQTAIATANQTAANALMYMGQHFGVSAANWVNDNYMKKELEKVDKTIADTAAGGRSATTLSAAQFHTGGTITGFGDYATSHNEGMIHAMLGETVMTPGATQQHGDILAAMNSGASAAQVAARYLAGSGGPGMSAQGGAGGDTHFHVHTLDTKTMSTWLKNGGAQMITKHQNNYSAQYAGDGIGG